MKTLTATLHKSTYDFYYPFDGIHFAFCTAPIEPTKRRVIQITEWQSCRENMARNLRNRINRNTGKIDIKTTRLLLYMKAPMSGVYWLKERKEENITKHRKLAHLQMQASLRLINHFERRAGWRPTRIYKMSPNKPSPEMALYMVIGSSRWMKSTHCFSLYLLMLRLGRSNLPRRVNKTHEEYLEMLKSYSKRTSSDACFVRQTYPKWDIFLKNQDKIFAGRNRKSIFSRNSLLKGYDGYNEGIKQLCIGRTRDLKLKNKFQKICEDHNID